MKKIINGICVAFGFLCMGLGIIGAILPVLPTTPFLILSAAMFAKGSDRFHKWFEGTKIYRKYIEQTVKNKQMTAKAKRSVLMTLSVLFGIGFILSPSFAKVIIVFVAAFHFHYFLIRIKTVNEDENKTAVD